MARRRAPRAGTARERTACAARRDGAAGVAVPARGEAVRAVVPGGAAISGRTAVPRPRVLPGRAGLPGRRIVPGRPDRYPGEQAYPASGRAGLPGFTGRAGVLRQASRAGQPAGLPDRAVLRLRQPPRSPRRHTTRRLCTALRPCTTPPRTTPRRRTALRPRTKPGRRTARPPTRDGSGPSRRYPSSPFGTVPPPPARNRPPRRNRSTAGRRRTAVSRTCPSCCRASTSRTTSCARWSGSAGPWTPAGCRTS